MKTTLLIVAIALSGMTRLFAQIYPYWDSDNPAASDSGNDLANNYNCVSTNAVFRLGHIESLNPVAGPIERWTPCGGWEQLPGCTMYRVGIYGGSHANRVMTVHDHNLYVVGDLSLDGTNHVGVVKFDLNTGTWSAIDHGLNTTNCTPWTIAVDAMTNIYVGCYEYADTSDPYNEDGTYANQTLTNLFKFSTNGGASWKTVGDGLVAGPTAPAPSITGLYADGTNIYLCGDFTSAAGQPANSSPHVIMWTGNVWGNLDGVYNSGGEFFGHETTFNIDEVNSIVGIGTNIYVTGVFDYPSSGIARFSNVSGHALPIDGLEQNLSSPDPIFHALWGDSLAVNNGRLYLAGGFAAPNGIATNYVCLLDPEATYPTNWTNAFPESIQDGSWGGEVSCAVNGNAVYVATPNGPLNRLVLGPDEPSPTAQIITNITLTSVSIAGTAQSRWQVLYSSDKTSWDSAGFITLWGGTGVLSMGGIPNPLPKYWKLADNCSETIYTNQIINVQFSGYDGQATKTDEAAAGYAGDYWNVVPFLDGEEDEIGDPGSSVYATISCSDNHGNATPVTVDLLTEGDVPYGIPCGEAIDGIADEATDPLMQGIDTEDSGSPLDVAINGLKPHASYDIYLYGLGQNGASRWNSHFQLLTNGVLDVATSSSYTQQTDSGLGWNINSWQEGKQYVVFRNVHFTSPNSGTNRNIKIRVSGNGTSLSVINGLQIVRRP